MNTRRVANLLAYICIGLIAVSLIVKYMAVNVFSLGTDIVYWCDKIAYYMACLSTLICAFSYASSRRNGMFMGLLVVFVVVIILFSFVIV